MAQNSYSLAPEVEEVASRILAEFHPHLDGIRIVYLWRTTAVKRRDKTDFGTVAKISGRSAFLGRIETDVFELVATAPATSFFVLEVWQQGWNALDDAKQARLVDHLLTFLEAKEIANDKTGEVTTSLSLRAADVVQFVDVESRHKPTLAGEYERIAEKIAGAAQAEKLNATAQESNGKKVGKSKAPKRKKPNVDERPGVSVETETIGNIEFTLAITPEDVGDGVVYNITRRVGGGEPEICVSGQRGKNAEIAREWFASFLKPYQLSPAEAVS